MDGRDHYDAAIASEAWQDKVAEALLGILDTLLKLNARYQEAPMRCDVCGETMRPETGLPSQQMAEVYDPANPQAESVVCHQGCMPPGWEIA
jgi:rubredoxin